MTATINNQNPQGKVKMGQIIRVEAMWDPEAKVWYVHESNLPGLSTEAATVELMLAKLPAMISDLLADNCLDGEEHGDVPIELVAHTSLKAALVAA